MSDLEINDDVLAYVLSFCDKPSLRNFMCASRAAHRLVLPFLLASVSLRSSTQLSTFCHFAISSPDRARIPLYIRSLLLSGQTLRFPHDTTLLVDILRRADGLEELTLLRPERLFINAPQLLPVLARLPMLSRFTIQDTVPTHTAGAAGFLRSLAGPVAFLSVRRPLALDFAALGRFQTTLCTLHLDAFAPGSVLPQGMHWPLLTELVLRDLRVPRHAIARAFPNLLRLQIEDGTVSDEMHAENTRGDRTADWIALDCVGLDLASAYNFGLASTVRRLEFAERDVRLANMLLKHRKVEDAFCRTVENASPTVLSVLASLDTHLWSRLLKHTPRLSSLHLLLIGNLFREPVTHILHQSKLAHLPLKYICIELHAILSLSPPDDELGKRIRQTITEALPSNPSIEYIEIVWGIPGRERARYSYQVRQGSDVLTLAELDGDMCEAVRRQWMQTC